MKDQGKRNRKDEERTREKIREQWREDTIDRVKTQIRAALDQNYNGLS